MKRPTKDESALRISHASAIEHFLAHRPKWIQRLEIDRPADALKGRLADIISRANAKGIPVVAGRSHAPGEPINAVVGDFPYTDFADLVKWQKDRERVGLVALDHIQDPQNFGAICRSAEAFGARGVLFPKDRSAAITASVVHASAGAVATLPICRVTNLGEALRKLKEDGYWIIGSDLGERAMTPWQIPDFEKWVLVIGAEGDGMTQLIKGLCDVIVQIPLPGQVQSLNASAAASALLYELTRPRLESTK